MRVSPVAVLIPGYLLDADIWSDTTRRLAPEQQVVIPDLSRFETIEAMAAHLLANIPGRFAAAGLSMGGYVAMEMARRAPDRIERLALINTKPTPDTAATAERRADLQTLVEAGRQADALRALEPLMLSDAHRARGASALERLRAMYDRSDATQFIRHQRALTTRPDHRDSLPGFDMPTLVLASRKDALIPLEVTLDMIGRLPDARAVIFESTGHLSLLERPDETANILSHFLKGAAP